MAWPDLRKGRSTGLLFCGGTGLLRSLGDSALPVSLSIIEFPLVPYPRTRMVPRDWLPRPHFPPNRLLERLNHPRSPAVSWAGNINLPSVEISNHSHLPASRSAPPKESPSGTRSVSFTATPG